MGTSWSYSRPAYAAPSPGNAPIHRVFLMPHFAFWGWPLPYIGTARRIAAAIATIEASLPFDRKNPRPIWRGTKRYNSAHHPRLRDDLLNVTQGQAWADVQELHWEKLDADSPGATKGKMEAQATNSIGIEDFCRHKYVLHTDGITYSGRLQFHQMCRSVVITPPIAWMQHTTHLIRPLFSTDLRLGGGGGGGGGPGDKTARRRPWEPSEGEAKAWPVHYAPEQANMIFVAPDWSDLKATIDWLEAHPGVAEGIATRQRELFVDRGYLSPAAETCYWRALIRGWSQAVRTDDQGWEEQKGVSWEVFALGHEQMD